MYVISLLPFPSIPNRPRPGRQKHTRFYQCQTVPLFDFSIHFTYPEELNKIGELLTGIPASEITYSSNNNKPTVRIRRKTKSSDSMLFTCGLVSSDCSSKIYDLEGLKERDIMVIYK